jgi:hypothetical protein
LLSLSLSLSLLMREERRACEQVTYSLTHHMSRITLLSSFGPSFSCLHLQSVWEEQVAKNPTEAGAPIKIK